MIIWVFLLPLLALAHADDALDVPDAPEVSISECTPETHTASVKAISWKTIRGQVVNVSFQGCPRTQVLGYPLFAPNLGNVGQIIVDEQELIERGRTVWDTAAALLNDERMTPLGAGRSDHYARWLIGIGGIFHASSRFELDDVGSETQLISYLREFIAGTTINVPKFDFPDEIVLLHSHSEAGMPLGMRDQRFFDLLRTEYPHSTVTLYAITAKDGLDAIAKMSVQESIPQFVSSTIPEKEKIDWIDGGVRRAHAYLKLVIDRLGEKKVSDTELEKIGLRAYHLREMYPKMLKLAPQQLYQIAPPPRDFSSCLPGRYAYTRNFLEMGKTDYLYGTTTPSTWGGECTGSLFATNFSITQAPARTAPRSLRNSCCTSLPIRPESPTNSLPPFWETRLTL